MADRKKIEQAKMILLLGKIAMANFHINPKVVDEEGEELMLECLTAVQCDLADSIDLSRAQQKEAINELKVTEKEFFNMLEVPN
tara:strand:- start:2254 stop:2505 length:252 start_codon:yes stop_codon:yes gene_type:complete